VDPGRVPAVEPLEGARVARAGTRHVVAVGGPRCTL